MQLDRQARTLTHFQVCRHAGDRLFGQFTSAPLRDPVELPVPYKHARERGQKCADYG